MRTRDLQDLVKAAQELELRGDVSDAIVDGYRVSALLENMGVQMRQVADEPLAAVEPSGEALKDVGRFIVGRELGKGAMGRVIEARDPELRRTVALKLMLEPNKVSDAKLARFVAEAQVTGQLNHPNIVRIHELGLTRDGQLYFAMPRVEGRSLAEVVAALRAGEEEVSSEWKLRRLLSSFVQVCHAVAYAHDRGVLHRDLKPDNIMLGAFGEVLVMDWGVAGIIGDRSERVQHEQVERVTVTKTMDGAIIGTPGYISPEQVRGQLHRLDGRSDQWSLGAILYDILTLKPAYEGPSAMSVMVQTVTGPPVDPRERAPERRISAELAEICLTAMATDREDRFPTVEDLANAIDAVLEGSRRRRQANRHAIEAEKHWEHYLSRHDELRRLIEGESILRRVTPSFTPLAEKAELLEVQDRIETLKLELEETFESLVRECETALSLDSDHIGVKGFLARAYWTRFLEAEENRDTAMSRLYEGRVRAHDPGMFTELLEGTGAVSLSTSPPGAEVLYQRFRQRGLIWSLTEPETLGTTPLDAVPLAMGSYLLTLKSPNMRDTLYPINIARGHHWESGRKPIPLFADDEIGEDWIYVPPGPFIAGGDTEADYSLAKHTEWVDGFFIAKFPVTVQLYCEFLNALADRDPDEAWNRVPRVASGPVDSTGQWWRRPKRGDYYSVPEWDQGGDTLDPMRPVTHVSWRDAMAFVDWLNIRDGLHHAYDLARELQWEKAARGVDGRWYPWGDRFDSTLCKMRDSRRGRPVIERIGAFRTDRSVYGVRELAGSVQGWCSDLHFNGDGELRVIRGGAWNSSHRECRVARRQGSRSWTVAGNIGFRLIRRSTVDGRSSPEIGNAE